MVTLDEDTKHRIATICELHYLTDENDFLKWAVEFASLHVGRYQKRLAARQPKRPVGRPPLPPEQRKPVGRPQLSGSNGRSVGDPTMPLAPIPYDQLEPRYGGGGPVRTIEDLHAVMAREKAEREKEGLKPIEPFS
jgi:hypothetical protein